MIHVIVAIAAIIAIVILAKGCIREHREAKRIQGVLDELKEEAKAAPFWWEVSVDPIYHYSLRSISNEDLIELCEWIAADQGEEA